MPWQAALFFTALRLDSPEWRASRFLWLLFGPWSAPCPCALGDGPVISGAGFTSVLAFPLKAASGARGHFFGHRSVSFGFRSASSGLYRQTLNPPPTVATAAAAFFPCPAGFLAVAALSKKRRLGRSPRRCDSCGCGRRLNGGFGRAARKAAMNAASHTEHGDLP